ncbi:class I SAM-dependent methyltransferase [Phreatobacter stygius]|uniref:Class I SAM-dependent methyltransferase n=1 Tax=Phreatobacter stygius TaxID=1940610 RepID=A0A4D7B8D8_9HYPH|nr:class I SAM-dependent methyltransferase [Phreatobacter stygius]QCI64277.1 class I SAM-dependent methyltransferase [Phreatobacter stygius]
MTLSSPTNNAAAFGLYGLPPADLAEVPAGAIQFSPLMPGSMALEAQGEGSLAGMIVSAPPGTLERRYTLALTLKALAPGARLVVLAPKDKGGSRLRRELEGFGCVVEETARRHHRICTVARPQALGGLDTALVEGAQRLVPDIGLQSQPGVFSWDRVDRGSALLVEHLPNLAGRGADLGCGIGVLSRAILASPAVSQLALVDIDRRALEATRINVTDARVTRIWADLRQPPGDLKGLDFVVMNPPFHDGGAEDKALGQAFVRRAAELLKARGICWLVANRHLPYEAVLAPLFKTVTMRVETGAYKVYEAQK